MSHEAEGWLEIMDGLYAWLGEKTSDFDVEMELRILAQEVLLAMFGRDERVILTDFPYDDDSEEGQKAMSDVEREYGIGRVEFPDGSALVYWEAWVSLGIHASRLDGSDPCEPFLCIELMEGMGGYHLPMEALH